MTIPQYIAKIAEGHLSGITSERLFREDLKQLIEGCAPDVSLIEIPAEPALPFPDYIITKRDVPVGYLLIYPVDKPLDSQGDQRELELLKRSLANLMLTNHLGFQLYRDGIPVSSAAIAEVKNGRINSRPGEHPSLEVLIKTFSSYHPVAINVASELSRTLAREAQLLAAAIEKSIIQDGKKRKNQFDKPAKLTLKEQLTDISIILKYDIPAKELADIYAQTISFGMFAARLYGGPALEEFSRQNIDALIPSSYSFLKKLFQYISGKDLDERLAWIINELAALFSAIRIPALLENFRESARQNNPVKQFYKNFLNEYHPGILKERGEISATEPIIRFMKQAVMDCRSSFQSGSNAQQR